MTEGHRPTPRRLPSEELWRLHREGSVASCALREPPEGGSGWELVIRIDDDITGTRHYDSERIARYYADALRQDYGRDGWT
ncbi:MAG TPA: hypothetical protein VFP91_11400 [Vicinamibacterales bacterium]|nr:hypothetical protein [Vicinamibacterales bacterium]